MKETLKTIFAHIAAVLIIALIIGNIVQYVQCQTHIGTIIHLQKELQMQQEMTIKVLDKVTDKHGYRTIKD